MTLFWHGTGPLLAYAGGTLTISDLNPEARLTWRISRIEMARIGLRAVWAAIFAD